MMELAGSETSDGVDQTVATTTIAADRGADVVSVRDSAENIAAVSVAKTATDPDAVE
jgi:dihydropteroate synthase